MSSMSGHGPIERRRKPRIAVPFPAKVQGADDVGRTFEVETFLDDLSSNSLYLRVAPAVAPGASLRISFQPFTTNGSTKNLAQWVKVEGTVVRVDEKPGGVYGVAVVFVRSQFQPSP